MSCCKRVKPGESQQNIVNAVQKQTNSQPTVKVYAPNSGVKSNRSPAGTIARQCPNCGTKTISIICPACQSKLD